MYSIINIGGCQEDVASFIEFQELAIA